MARGEFVHNDIWEELEPLSQDATCLYIWAFTNPRCNMAGLYKVSERSMLESKVPPRRLGKALEELEQLEFAFYRMPWLWVKGRIRRLHSTHPNYAKAVAKDLAQMEADHPLRVLCLNRYAAKGWLAPFLSDLALESQKVKTLPTPSETLLRESQLHVQCIPPEEQKTVGEQPDLDARALEQAPAELRPHVAAVRATLARVAAGKPGAKVVTVRSVAKALTDRERKDHEAAAADFEHYWLHGNGETRPLKDVVAAYRNWLDRAPDVAAKTAGQKAGKAPVAERFAKYDRAMEG